MSIPDQRRQGEAYCLSRGYGFVETFIEAGPSATNDRRPEFQRMIGAGGLYRYYACSTQARQGKTGCEGRSIPMDRLDQLVASHVEERLLQPERLGTVTTRSSGGSKR